MQEILKSVREFENYDMQEILKSVREFENYEPLTLYKVDTQNATKLV